MVKNRDRAHILFFLIGIFIFLSAVIGCANHPCREPRVPEMDQTRSPRASTDASSSDIRIPLFGGLGENSEKPTASTSNSSPANSASPLSATSSRPSSKESQTAGASAGPKLRVFKPDGSRQCERRAGIAVDLMERELAGIPVYSREKRRDGSMHIQVCGSPTGMINLFEVDAKNLKQSEERGFRRWEE